MATHHVSHAATATPPLTTREMVLGITFIIVTAIVYLLPALTAGRRRHHNLNAIAAFNLLLGWTFLGWVLALVWSLTAVQRRSDDPHHEAGGFTHPI